MGRFSIWDALVFGTLRDKCFAKEITKKAGSFLENKSENAQETNSIWDVEYLGRQEYLGR